MRELRVDYVDLLDVRETHGPGAGAQALDAADNLGESLEQHQSAGNWDHSLEMVYRRTLCGDIGVLADAPGIGGITVAGIDQTDNPGDEEKEVQREIERRLGAR